MQQYLKEFFRNNVLNGWTEWSVSVTTVLACPEMCKAQHQKSENQNDGASENQKLAPRTISNLTRFLILEKDFSVVQKKKNCSPTNYY